MELFFFFVTCHRGGDVPSGDVADHPGELLLLLPVDPDAPDARRRVRDEPGPGGKEKTRGFFFLGKLTRRRNVEVQHCEN